ncbi:MAG: dihydrodipicolinate synthase family protein [Bacteroidetes bacterium]|nr:dihydrodipicolinate synthase family protein [Bacteroidota bacterium]
MDLKGILPPVPTPFVEGMVSTKRLTDNIKKLNATNLSGYLILGSNGEAVMLSEEERKIVLDTARAAIPKEKIMMAGAGQESTRETIRTVQTAAECGADCVLVITPSFFKSAITQEAMVRHYLDVAESAKVPVLLYSVPQYTGMSLQAATVARLAEHPNIAGMKDSSGNMSLFADIVSHVPPDFAMFVGNANTLLAALALGAVGGILAVANILPEACVRLQTLWQKGNVDEARKLQLRLNPLSSAVTSIYGVAGLKAAMDMCGFHGGETRLPLLPVGEKATEEIKNQLDALAMERTF